MKIVGTYSSKALAGKTARALRASGSKKYTWFTRKSSKTGLFNLIRAEKGDL